MKHESVVGAIGLAERLLYVEICKVVGLDLVGEVYWKSREGGHRLGNYANVIMMIASAEVWALVRQQTELEKKQKRQSEEDYWQNIKLYFLATTFFITVPNLIQKEIRMYDKKFTEEQLKEYREKWIALGLSTVTDRKAAELAIDEVYTLAGLKAPKLKIWGRSPMEGIAEVAKLTGESVKQVNSNGPSIFGSHDAYWMAFYDVFKGIVSDVDKLEGLFKLSQTCGWCWPFNDAVILTDKPVALSLDEENRLHSTTGAALLYGDGFGVWAIHGLRIEKRFIEEPVNMKDIDSCANQELKRVLIERYGEHQYILDSGISPIQKDKFGELYRKDVAGDEPIVMVRVQNSTPEKDGSRHIYWLRIPPTIKTAKEGIAWTFGVSSKEYTPLSKS